MQTKSLKRQLSALFLLVLTTTLACAADTNKIDSPSEIVGWASVHPTLPKPMKEGNDYAISLVSQKEESGALVITLEFKTAKAKDNVPAVLTVVQSSSIRQGSFTIVDGQIETVGPLVQKQKQGRMKFSIAREAGTKVLLADPHEPNDSGKSSGFLAILLRSSDALYRPAFISRVETRSSEPPLH